jgi:hypothetical protein
MASVIDVCNRALQKLGAKRISALTDQTPSARACALAYPIIRQSELRKYDWNFAISRVQLAADSPAPTWGRQNSFTLPADYIKLTNAYPETLSNDINTVGVSVAFTAESTGMRDWVIEGKKIVTNDSSPLNLRYIADITDTSMWDAIFVEVVATAMAYELCEELTQSNTKKSDIAQAYKTIIDSAKHASSIEIAPADPPPDTWLTCRN